jgi:hypothetical protein
MDAVVMTRLMLMMIMTMVIVLGAVLELSSLLTDELSDEGYDDEGCDDGMPVGDSVGADVVGVCVGIITHWKKLTLLLLMVLSDPYADSHDEQDSLIGMLSLKVHTIGFGMMNLWNTKCCRVCV